MNSRLVLTGATVAALVGSLTGTASAHPARGTAAPVVYHDKASGHTISVAEGKTFKVSLEACGDCGQHWSFTHRPAAATVEVEHRRVVSDAKPPAVGGNDHTIWTFRAVSTGKTTMRMVERSADDGNKVIKRFTLTVEVHEILAFATQ